LAAFTGTTMVWFTSCAVDHVDTNCSAHARPAEVEGAPVVVTPGIVVDDVVVVIVEAASALEVTIVIESTAAATRKVRRRIPRG
jgi:hypothetical protein